MFFTKKTKPVAKPQAPIESADDLGNIPPMKDKTLEEKPLEEALNTNALDRTAVLGIEPVKEEDNKDELKVEEEEATPEPKNKVKPYEQKKDFSDYENVDWKRVSPEKVFSVLAEVMLENKRLNFELERLNKEIEQSYKTNVESKDRSMEHLEDIAHKCAPDVIKQINEGAKLNPTQVKERIIHDVLVNKRKLLNKIMELDETIKSNKILLNELQQQCYSLISQGSTNQQMPNNNNVDEEPAKPFTREDFKKIAVDNMPEDEPNEPKCVLKFVPLDEARELFGQMDVLNLALILGKKGVSEFPKIVIEAQKYGISENRVETLIAKMEKNDIVEITKVFTFQRNTGLRLVKLKDLGITFYKEHYKELPVKPEMQIIKEENDNYEHGYSIKDVLTCLADMGYEEYSMSRDTNTIKFENGYSWIPDIIAFNPITKKREYFEVEMGTHNQDNFFTKLDKALLVVNELKIIVKNKIVADKVLAKCTAWYNQKKSKPNLVIKVYTYQEFKQKIEASRFVPHVLENKEGLLDETINKNNPANTKNEKQESKKEKRHPSSSLINQEEEV